jgi:hypothetical protein
MEQQIQTKTAARTEKTPTEERIRKSDGPRLAQTDIAAKAAMAGADLRQIPADRLRELAVRLGNSGMEALLASQTPAPRLTEFMPPGPTPETKALPIPAAAPELTQAPQLTQSGFSGAPFDPAGLQR